MTPILKKTSKKGISLLLALSLFVGTAGTVSANATTDGRAEASAVEEVVTDPVEAALDEVEQPAAEEAEPEAEPEQPAAEEPETEPPTAEEAEPEPPAEEETLVPETETTQEEATQEETAELAAAGDAGRAGAVRLPSDWDEKMKEYFPDENLRRMVKEKFESGEAYRGGRSTEDVLAYCKSFTLEYTHLCPENPANVTDFTGLEKLATRQFPVDGEDPVVTVKCISPSMDMSVWEKLAAKIGERLLYIKLDYGKAVPAILTVYGREYRSDSRPGEPDRNLPSISALAFDQEFFANTAELNYVRSNNEKTVTVYFGVKKRCSDGSTKGIVDTGHVEIMPGRLTSVPGVMEVTEKNQNQNYVKLVLKGKTTIDHNTSRIYAFGYCFTSYDTFGQGTGDTSNTLSYSYRYPLKAMYYSAVNWEIQSQLYSGFKFKKTSSLDGTQSLAGAKYIVSRQKQAVYTEGEANALSKSWLAGTPKYETDADGSVNYSKPIYEKDAAGQPVYEYLKAEGQKTPYTAAVFTTDKDEAKVYTTDADGTFTADMIPAGSLQTAAYKNATDKTQGSSVSTRYYVTEVEAPDGYALSDANPTEITVTGNTSGIRLEAEGGYGNTINDVCTGEVTLKADFIHKGNHHDMEVEGEKTAQHATVFIRNAEDADNKLDAWGIPTDEKDVKYVTVNYTKNGSENDRYETLQDPGYKVVDLEGNVVPGLENITSIEDLSGKINTVIIDGNLAQQEKDSYNIVAAQADANELVYYDKNWETNYQIADADGNNSIAGTQKDDPKPVKVEFRAMKVFTGGTLAGNDFRFSMVPVTLVQDGTLQDDPLAGGSQVTNDPDGTVNFGYQTYLKPGEYTYTVAEDTDWYQGVNGNPAAAGITFDTKVHNVVVNVAETVTAPGVTNGLTATVTVDGVQIGQATSVNTTPSLNLATFKNTIARDTGSLTVTKTVAGDLGDRGVDWNFTVTLDDTTINGTYGDMTFVDGVARFVLKHGDSKKAADLPAGVPYTVVETEANQNGYATTATGDRGTIEKDQTKKAEFTNTYNSPLPITGGMGTNVFYQLGGAVISAAVFLLIATKKRKRHTVQ